LDQAWERLRRVRQLSFQARSLAATATGWNGRGSGTAEVETVHVDCLLFREQGTWLPEGGRRLRFSNVYRWTIDRARQVLRLEHLRFGPASPVFLFDLVPAGDGLLECACPHACGADAYAARLRCDPDAVRLDWTVTGPGKDERISYVYH
jgi:hypothetical protein